MKNQSIVFGAIGFLIGVMITGLVAGYAVNRGYRGGTGMMGADSNRMAGGDIDRHFIEQMIPHHESAIAMAKLAQQKSTHLEIKTLAGNIITSQTTEIDKMKEWYKQWYGTDVPKLTNSSSMMSMMDSTESEASLNQATDFDKAFLEQMIPHHQMAVMMANMLEDGTRRQEMRTLAQDIVLAQSKEIDAMRNWQVQWGYVSGEQFTDGMMHAM